MSRRAPCVMLPCDKCVAARRVSYPVRKAWHDAQDANRVRRLCVVALLTVGVALTALSVPAEGLPGAALGLVGMAAVTMAVLVWRRERRVRMVAEIDETIRRINTEDGPR